MAGSGLDLDAGKEKALLRRRVRILAIRSTHWGRL